MTTPVPRRPVLAGNSMAAVAVLDLLLEIWSPGDVLVLAPCGWGLERAREEAKAVADRVQAVGARRVLVLDGSAYFNRPGPRLVDSLETLVDNLMEN